MKIFNKKLLYCFCAATFVVTILLSIGASVKGAQLLSVQKQINKLEEDNKELSANFISKSSLQQANLEAQSLGLTTTRTVVYLNADVVVAQLR